MKLSTGANDPMCQLLVGSGTTCSVDSLVKVRDCPRDMMISSSLHVLDREGYIDRFDIPGKRVRGTRVLQPDVRGHQLKLDAAKLREKERRDRAKLKMMISGEELILKAGWKLHSAAAISAKMPQA